MVWILCKMSGCAKTFKVNMEINKKTAKLMSFRIDDEKLLEKYQTILNKIKDLKNIVSNALPVYNYRLYKTEKEHTAIKFILTLMA